jgi:hypothetical protein
MTTIQHRAFNTCHVLKWRFSIGFAHPLRRGYVSHLSFSPSIAPGSEFFKRAHWAFVKSIAVFLYLHPSWLLKRTNRKRNWFPGVDKWVNCSWHWNPHSVSMCKNWGAVRGFQPTFTPVLPYWFNKMMWQFLCSQLGKCSAEPLHYHS